MKYNYQRTIFDMAQDMLVNKLVYEKIILTTEVIHDPT